MIKTYETVSLSEVGFDSDPLIVRYSRLAWLYPPVLFTVMAVGITLAVVVVNQSPMALAYLGGAIAFSYFIFSNTLKTGALVFAANGQGIYYPIYNQKDQFVFLSWDAIKEIAVYTDEAGKALEITTNFESYTRLPKPCNGHCSLKRDSLFTAKPNGVTTVELYVKTGRQRTSDIMKAIDKLSLSKIKIS
ncbi:hypothetical protein AADEFJLK_04696 [Methylovulum psychrotolerans]|uniref:Uncharacterized protein n=2 Tax=Methylovulum psychrotolerans TaxID=1704499 RepID=A0A2S5CFF5_9GAMM|nr:hypothetical protein AADEFJLK_04696 [Methylovulum psychrotolerans]